MNEPWKTAKLCPSCGMQACDCELGVEDDPPMDRGPETGELAEYLYAAFVIWEYRRSKVLMPLWDALRHDYKQKFLALAEKLTGGA